MSTRPDRLPHLEDVAAAGVGYTNWEYKRFTLDPLRSAAVPHNSFCSRLRGRGATLGVYLVLVAVSIRRLGELERTEVAARSRAEGLLVISGTRIAGLVLVYSLFSELWS